MGNANYIMGNFLWKDYGAFFRYTQGTSNGIMGQLGTKSSKSWIQQVVEQDIRNDILGDFSYTDANRLDMGKSIFKNSIFGVTYHITSDFLVSLGMNTITATDGKGRPARENILERFPDISNQSNLSKYLESPQGFQRYQTQMHHLGYTSPGQFATNEWIGKKRVFRQIFIRAQFVFGTVDSVAERN